MENTTASGYVDAFLIDPEGGKRQVVSGSNTLLYRCADAVAHIFAGATDYVPTVIGFITAPASSADLSAGNFHFNDGDRTTKSQADLVDTKVLTVQDVNIGQNKQFVPTGSGYTGNKVTLGAMTTNNVEEEDIYGMLLKDSEGRVIAVKKLPSKVRRAAGYAFMVSWAVTFN